MPKRFHVTISIATHASTFEYGPFEEDSLDAAVQHGIELHPDCTSMVIMLVVNPKDQNDADHPQ